MSRKVIATQDAPAAIGPYSQAVSAGPYLYTAGQIPIDPATGQVVEGDIAKVWEIWEDPETDRSKYGRGVACQPTPNLHAHGSAKEIPDDLVHLNTADTRVDDIILDFLMAESLAKLDGGDEKP